MKIDLRKLYSKGIENIDATIKIPEELYKKCGIKQMDDVKVEGTVSTDYEENIVLNITLTGKMIMPCAISLEDVDVPFNTTFEETIPKIEENNQFYLDLFDILWENIVLEIPIRVIKEGVKPASVQGKGWTLEIED